MLDFFLNELPSRMKKVTFDHLINLISDFMLICGPRNA